MELAVAERAGLDIAEAFRMAEAAHLSVQTLELAALSVIDMQA